MTNPPTPLTSSIDKQTGYIVLTTRDGMKLRFQIPKGVNASIQRSASESVVYFDGKEAIKVKAEGKFQLLDPCLESFEMSLPAEVDKWRDCTGLPGAWCWLSVMPTGTARIISSPPNGRTKRVRRRNGDRLNRSV
ncbi:hypothetical protein [Seinonella peptonophila]|nr:hypothetical protein [Seinonella peptonophila]